MVIRPYPTERGHPPGGACRFALAFGLLLSGTVQLLAGEVWSEILSTPEDEKAGEPILDIVAFDGRLYLRQLRKPGPAAILSLSPKEDMAVEKAAVELKTESSGLGLFRVLDGKLHIPDAGPPAKTPGGYYVSAGGGRWERVSVGDEPACFYDIASFDGKLFLAGNGRRGALVCSSRDGGKSWEMTWLNAEAARWSPRASHLLTVGKELFVMAAREVDKAAAATNTVAPIAWGAWYLLSYFPAGSDRGLYFDGPPRPVLALREIAPGTSIASPGFFLGSDAPFRDGVVYVVLSSDGTARDSKGGLFYAVPKDVPAAGGRILAGRRIPKMDLARAVKVEKGTCYVLLAENASTEAQVMASRDLETWQTIFDGKLPSQAVSLGVADGACYLGLLDGAVGCVTE